MFTAPEIVYFCLNYFESYNKSQRNSGTTLKVAVVVVVVSRSGGCSSRGSSSGNTSSSRNIAIGHK